jgi:catechol 2,3-dioxygenase-like lactoylglutathione lyase family enzyme
MRLALITLVVRDYDEAIAYYCNVLGFALKEDSIVTPEKRWVVVSPGEGGADILLAKAESDEQRAAIGNQTGGRVALFLHTADFEETFQRMKQAGVEFIEAPRDEPYGRVVVFLDLYGNKWDLIEPV